MIRAIPRTRTGTGTGTGSRKRNQAKTDSQIGTRLGINPNQKMTRIHKTILSHLVLALSLALSAPGAARADESLKGVVEERARKWIILDSTRVALVDGARISGDADRQSEIKIGFWAEASGEWNDRGIFKAREIRVARTPPGDLFSESLRDKSSREATKLQASRNVHGDEAVSAYVSALGLSLVPRYARREFSFSFTMINDPSLNAFALPNGAIFVHTGLLAKMDNEAQLATVLGHEISHVTQLHGQRQYKKIISFIIPAQIGALVLGTEVQKQTDSPVLRAMASLGLNLGMAAAVNGYGRTLEDQADRVGLRYTVGRGYDPREAPGVWDIFNDIYGDESKVENFLYSNHSTNKVRKGNILDEIDIHYRSRLPGYKARKKSAPAKPLTELKVARDEYRSRMVDVVRMTAVADFDLERYRLARKGFSRVLEVRPEDPVVFHYKGRIVLATGEGARTRERARTFFERAIELDPAYAAAHKDLGLLYKDMKMGPEARTHLQKYLDLAPEGAKDRIKIRRAIGKIG
jgi:predicted Zn-dependent protease